MVIKYFYVIFVKTWGISQVLIFFFQELFTEIKEYKNYMSYISF